jgi:FPC/CPF motif-containing protein YcgG
MARRIYRLPENPSQKSKMPGRPWFKPSAAMKVPDEPWQPRGVTQARSAVTFMLPVAFDNGDPLAEAFRDFLIRPEFPCVGAKAALARGQIQFLVARDMTSAWDDLRIYPALFNFAGLYRAQPALFQSFVVLFRGPATLDEAQYETCLWERLQSLTDKDDWHGQAHDARVSADPADPHFSLSFGNEAFFVVGLHPNASRPARRFSHPALVFNPHDQFEKLREENLYKGLRERITQRDEALAGSRNPMLQTFGEKSEAPQYSGRIVEDAWKCPYHRR